MEVARALVSMGLGRYARRFEELGYDDLDFLRRMDADTLQSVADVVQMAPGHKLKFVHMIRAEPTSGRLSAPATQVVMTPCGGLAREQLEWLAGGDCEGEGPGHVRYSVDPVADGLAFGAAAEGGAPPQAAGALRSPTPSGQPQSPAGPGQPAGSSEQPQPRSLSRVLSAETVLEAGCGAAAPGGAVAGADASAPSASGGRPQAAPLLPTLLTAKAPSQQRLDEKGDGESHRSELALPVSSKARGRLAMEALTPVSLPPSVNSKVCGQWALEASRGAGRWALEATREPRQWALEASRRAGRRALAASRLAAAWALEAAEEARGRALEAGKEAGGWALEASREAGGWALQAGGTLAQGALEASDRLAREALIAGAEAARVSSRNVDIALNGWVDQLHEHLLRLDSAGAEEAEPNGGGGGGAGICAWSGPPSSGQPLGVRRLSGASGFHSVTQPLYLQQQQQQQQQHPLLWAPQAAHPPGWPQVFAVDQRRVAHPGVPYQSQPPVAVHVQAAPHFMSAPTFYPAVLPVSYVQVARQPAHCR